MPENYKKDFNVFSCFDGISCGQQALVDAGIPYTKYYASEIDPRAIKVTTNNWPKTIQYGNIKKIKAEHFMSPIHLLMGGSPCQDLSVAGKGAGLSGARSGLFYEFVRLLNELNPTYFFLENVRMKKVYQDEISRILGVEPIYFDSALVSAQTRKRLYWTNIVSAADFVYPDDKGIVLNDILEFDNEFIPLNKNEAAYLESKKQYLLDKKFVSIDNDKALSIRAQEYSNWKGNYISARTHQKINGEHKFKLTDKANAIDANYFKGLANNQMLTCVKVGETDSSYEKQSRVYSPMGKSPAIDTQSGGDRGVKVANINVNPSGRGMNGVVHRTDKKCPTLTTNKGEGIKITTHSSMQRNGKGQGGKGHLSKQDGKTYCIDTTCTTMVEYADTYRKLTPIEVERCFSLPDNYTKGISPSARYHGLGNGWEVKTIVEFFKHIKV